MIHYNHNQINKIHNKVKDNQYLKHQKEVNHF